MKFHGVDLFFSQLCSVMQFYDGFFVGKSVAVKPSSAFSGATKHFQKRVGSILTEFLGPLTEPPFVMCIK